MRLWGLGWGLLLGGFAVSVGLAQKTDNLPAFAIQLPGGIASKSAEVAYMVNAGEPYEYILPESAPKNVDSAACNYVGSAGFGRVGACKSVREAVRVNPFKIYASVAGSAATRVQAMVFIPGCEMNRLDVAMKDKDVIREVKCVPLPHRTLKGQIADAAVTKTGGLKVHVTYRANWVSRLFEAGVEQANVFNRPLIEFSVASVQVSKDKRFSVELPILARDPGEMSALAEDRGEFVFTLRNDATKDGVVLGLLRPDLFATSSDGLELRIEYPEELRFVLTH
jgi:hypothetical protein